METSPVKEEEDNLTRCKGTWGVSHGGWPALWCSFCFTKTVGLGRLSWYPTELAPLTFFSMTYSLPTSNPLLQHIRRTNSGTRTFPNLPCITWSPPNPPCRSPVSQLVLGFGNESILNVSVLLKTQGKRSLPLVMCRYHEGLQFSERPGIWNILWLASAGTASCNLFLCLWVGHLDARFNPYSVHGISCCVPEWAGLVKGWGTHAVGFL